MILIVYFFTHEENLCLLVSKSLIGKHSLCAPIRSLDFGGILVVVLLDTWVLRNPNPLNSAKVYDHDLGLLSEDE